MLPIEIGLTMAFVFSIFLAVYHLATLLLASMLLNTLHLPVSYFHRAPVSLRDHREKLDQVFDQACRDELKVVYWLWFGHHHIPLDLVFLIITLIGILVAVGPGQAYHDRVTRLNSRLILADNEISVAFVAYGESRRGVSIIPSKLD